MDAYPDACSCRGTSHYYYTIKGEAIVESSDEPLPWQAAFSEEELRQITRAYIIVYPASGEFLGADQDTLIIGKLVRALENKDIEITTLKGYLAAK